MILTYTFDLAIAHHLPAYPGNCSRLHGHNIKVDLKIAGRVDPETGMVIDFKQLKTLVKDHILSKFDHRYLNEVEPFTTLYPTAENIAAVVAEIMDDVLPDEVEVFLVSVWESDVCSATFLGPKAKNIG